MTNPLRIGAPRFLGAALLAVTLCCGQSNLGQAAQWKVKDQGSRDVVRFTSNAPVELIEGQTNDIEGQIQYDDAFKFDAQHPFNIKFKVNLESLDTGIPLRNQHMRDNYLETGTHPQAEFKVNSIKTSAKPPFKHGETVVLQATGDFSLHGKTVKKTVPLKVTYFEESPVTKQRFPSGDMLRIQGMFPVNLAQHDIDRPEALFYKLADTIYVKVDVAAQQVK